MEMTYERAAEILDPERREAYDSIEPVITACKMGMEALKKQIPAKVICGKTHNLEIARIATKLFIDRPCSSAYIAAGAAKH